MGVLVRLVVVLERSMQSGELGEAYKTPKTGTRVSESTERMMDMGTETRQRDVQCAIAYIRI